MSSRTAKADDLARRLLAERDGVSASPPPDVPPEAPAGIGRWLRRVNHPRAVAFAHWYDGLLRVHQAAAQVLTEQDGRDHIAALGEDPSGLEELLLGIHRWLLEHPVAAKAAFRALVREGRAFADTEEGAALEQRLLRSSKMQSASLLFRSLSMGLLNDDSDGLLPSAYVDNVLRLIQSDRVELVLARLGRRPRGGGS